MIGMRKNRSAHKPAQTNINTRKADAVKPAEPFFREVQIEFLIHELKGPVAVVETGLRSLLEKRANFGPLSLRQEKTLQRTLRNARKTRQMLNELLEIGRSEAGCFSCHLFELKGAVRDALFESLETVPGKHVDHLEADDRLLETLTDYGIYLNMPPRIAEMELHQDEIKFRQIFGNLLKNALHHRKERIDIDISQTENRLQIDVCDDGPGIRPEHHETVFRRYVQINECALPSDRRGHGLGLANASILAGRLGGAVELSSEGGKGTRFRLTLPVQLTIER